MVIHANCENICDHIISLLCFLEYSFSPFLGSRLSNNSCPLLANPLAQVSGKSVSSIYVFDVIFPQVLVPEFQLGGPSSQVQINYHLLFANIV